MWKDTNVSEDLAASIFREYILPGYISVEAGVAQSVQWLGYGLDNRSSFPGGGTVGIFLFATASRPALRPIQPPIQWVPGAKRSEPEVDH